MSDCLCFTDTVTFKSGPCTSTLTCLLTTATTTVRLHLERSITENKLLLSTLRKKITHTLTKGHMLNILDRTDKLLLELQHFILGCTFVQCSIEPYTETIYTPTKHLRKLWSQHENSCVRQQIRKLLTSRMFDARVKPWLSSIDQAISVSLTFIWHPYVSMNTVTHTHKCTHTDTSTRASLHCMCSTETCCYTFSRISNWQGDPVATTASSFCC